MEQLSKSVANKLGVTPISSDLLWLHEDDARCYQLACDYNVNVHQTFDGAKAYIRFADVIIVEPWIGYPTKYQATNIAILKCILESIA